MHLIHSLLDLLFPPKCVFCRALLESGTERSVRIVPRNCYIWSAQTDLESFLTPAWRRFPMLRRCATHCCATSFTVRPTRWTATASCSPPVCPASWRPV